MINFLVHWFPWWIPVAMLICLSWLYFWMNKYAEDEWPLPICLTMGFGTLLTLSLWLAKNLP